MKQAITDLIRTALASLVEAPTADADALPAPQVDRTKDTAHGDFATNVALVLSKRLGAKPREVARADWQTYFQKEGDLDFHFRIVQGSGNRRLIDILCNDLYHLARMYRCQFGMKSDRAADALKEHELVADAIAERDGELAEWLMRRHIRASRRAIERRLAVER